MDNRDFEKIENEEVVKAPYHRLTYIDDYGYTHITTVNDTSCLQYLQSRFEILSSIDIEQKEFD